MVDAYGNPALAPADDDDVPALRVRYGPQLTLTLTLARATRAPGVRVRVRVSNPNPNRSRALANPNPDPSPSPNSRPNQVRLEGPLTGDDDVYEEGAQPPTLLPVP